MRDVDIDCGTLVSREPQTRRLCKHSLNLVNVTNITRLLGGEIERERLEKICITEYDDRIEKQKARLEELCNNISERLTGRKPVRNEVTSERGYCRIISVARAIARVTGIIRNILYYY